jgi:hypothetical protein
MIAATTAKNEYQLQHTFVRLSKQIRNDYPECPSVRRPLKQMCRLIDQMLAGGTHDRSR